MYDSRDPQAPGTSFLKKAITCFQKAKSQPQNNHKLGTDDKDEEDADDNEKETYGYDDDDDDYDDVFSVFVDVAMYVTSCYVELYKSVPWS